MIPGPVVALDTGLSVDSGQLYCMHALVSANCTNYSTVPQTLFILISHLAALARLALVRRVPAVAVAAAATAVRVHRFRSAARQAALALVRRPEEPSTPSRTEDFSAPSDYLFLLAITLVYVNLLLCFVVL